MMQHKRFLIPPDPLNYMDIRIDYGGFVACNNIDNCVRNNGLREVKNSWNHLGI